MRWEDISGQERAVRLLRGALEGGRVHHAYLLAGPEGVGKELLARTFAQAANCEADDPRARPCGSCPSCRGIERGNFPDVSFLMPQTELLARGLVSRADLEGVPSQKIRAAEGEARERAGRAQGSFSRALAAQGEWRELLEQVEDALEAADEREALDLAEAHGDRDAALEVAEAVQGWTRDLLVSRSGGSPQVRELAARAREIAERVPPHRLLGQAALCAEVIEALHQNGNGRLQLERLLLGTRELRHV